MLFMKTGAVLSKGIVGAAQATLRGNSGCTQQHRAVSVTCPDWWIVDLEDACPKASKGDVRNHLAALAKLANGPSQTDVGSGMPGGRWAVRVNSADAMEELRQDLEALVQPSVSAIVLPKLRSVRDLREVCRRLDEHETRRGMAPASTKIVLNIECPTGVLAAAELAAECKQRSIGIAFGHMDYLAANGGVQEPGPASLLWPRSRLAAVARAHDLFAIDTPFLDTSNPAGLFEECRQVRQLGFGGKFAIHPSQVATIHAAFAPSPAEHLRARITMSHNVDAQNGDAHKSHQGITTRRKRAPGCGFVGPPHYIHAANVLGHAASSEETSPFEAVGSKSETKSGKAQVHVARYGANAESLTPGRCFRSPYQITVTDATIEQWHAVFPATSGQMHTSKPLAQSYGLKDRPLPFDLMLNLAMGMSVDAFSESCLRHLGLTNGTYLRPVFPGDTLSNTATVLEVAPKPTSDGRFRIVKSLHRCTNQHGHTVFSVVKFSAFPSAMPSAISATFAEVPCSGSECDDGAVGSFWHTLMTRSAGERHLHPNGSGQRLQPGQVICHADSRPIGVSENLLFCNMMRNTHPLHYDYQRYGSEGVLVSGGYILSTVLGLTGRDLREIVHQQLLHAVHIAPVKPQQPLSAMSYIESVCPVNTDHEELVVKTLAFKNVDILAALELAQPANRVHPDLFGWHTDLNGTVKPSAIRERIHLHAPQLSHHAVLAITRKVRRPAHSIHIDE